MVGFYGRIWREAASQLAAEMSEVAPGYWRVRRDDRSTLIQNYIVQIDDPVILNLAGDKPLCHRLIAAQGLPVPPHQVYTAQEFDKARAFMAAWPGAAFVVKPAAGTSGARGVTTHVRTVAECRRASALASCYGPRLLIEQWIPGESYRLLFLDGELIHASRRRGARVVGDGRSTLGALLRRDGYPTTSGGSRERARDITATLEAQQLRLDSVLERGRVVVAGSVRRPLGGRVEARTVFDEDATADIGPALRDQAARAVQVIGSSFTGVDVITFDPSRALEETGGVVNEINTTPGLHHHYGLASEPPAVGPAVRVLARLLSVDVTEAIAYEGGRK